MAPPPATTTHQALHTPHLWHITHSLPFSGEKTQGRDGGAPARTVDAHSSSRSAIALPEFCGLLLEAARPTAGASPESYACSKRASCVAGTRRNPLNLNPTKISPPSKTIDPNTARKMRCVLHQLCAGPGCGAGMSSPGAIRVRGHIIVHARNNM